MNTYNEVTKNFNLISKNDKNIIFVKETNVEQYNV